MKLRITLLIILTLILGFAIGMLTSAQLRHKRMRPVRTYASEHYFREHLYKVVEPDSAQKAELDDIIDRYGEYFRDLNTGFWKDFESLMDKQWSEIKPVLSRDQIEKLEEFERQRREMMKEFRQRNNRGDSTRFDGRPDHDRRQGPGRRPPGTTGLFPNPQDQKTNSL
ncbi:MAG TPA: hypothetical protein ENH59_02560 [Bacteroidetes bacterium]|nr:hypothetical protein [Bacteroidota bacterium]